MVRTTPDFEKFARVGTVFEFCPGLRGGDFLNSTTGFRVRPRTPNSTTGGRLSLPSPLWAIPPAPSPPAQSLGHRPAPTQVCADSYAAGKDIFLSTGKTKSGQIQNKQKYYRGMLFIFFKTLLWQAHPDGFTCYGRNFASHSAVQISLPLPACCIIKYSTKLCGSFPLPNLACRCTRITL